jgi:hypothetical protein
MSIPREYLVGLALAQNAIPIDDAEAELQRPRTVWPERRFLPSFRHWLFLTTAGIAVAAHGR